MPTDYLDLLIAFDTEQPSAVDPDWLREKLVAVCRELRLEHVALNVVIVDDAAITDMHEKFLSVTGTTDVITFDLSDQPGDASRVDGEIYICLDEANRRAEQLAHPFAHELLLYAVHGLLHLLGYDDHDPTEHQRMHAKEDELLTKIGVGKVFGKIDS
jgi:probable rRNA maturation factor